MTISNQFNVKHVLMTTDTVGGVWTYSIELIRELCKLNIDITLVSMGRLPDRQQIKQISSFENVEFYQTGYKLEWMDSPWQDIEDASLWLLELEIMVHPDIIHLNGYVFGSLAWHAPVVIVAHSCVCSWFDQVKNCQIPEYLSHYKKRVSEGLEGADYIVAPSNAMLNSTVKHYGVQKRSRVIYNGKSSERFISTDKEPFIFTAGRVWDEAKNINFLMSVAPYLKWPLLVAGDYSEQEIKKEYNNVKFLGKLSPENVEKYMARASVYVLLARYEPFGLSILEAALAQCTLVLGNIESLREIWGDSAIFTDINNTTEAAETLNKVIENESIREEFGKKALLRAHCFSSEQMVENYLELYNALLTCNSNRKSISTLL